MLIRADPDHMFAVANRCNAIAAELGASGNQLGASWHALSSSWNGRSKADVEAQYYAARRALDARQAALVWMSRWLRACAERFIEADMAAGLELSRPQTSSFDPAGRAGGGQVVAATDDDLTAAAAEATGQTAAGEDDQ